MGPSEARGVNYHKVIATGDANPALLRQGAASLYGYDLFNVATYDVYLHFYDSATSPTVGTDVPVFTIVVPTLTDRAIQFPFGAHFKKGLAMSITKGAGDTDDTSLVAGDVVGAVFYK